MHKAILNHLHLSCTEPIALLARKGAQINIADNNGMVPIHNLAYWEKKDAKEALTLFTQYGGEIDTPDGQGMTTLQRSVQYGTNVQVTLALLAAGADPYVTDNRGNTLLHCVANNQTKERVKQFKAILPLVKSFNSKNNAGKTPFDLATKYNNNDIANEILKLLE